MYSGWRRYFWLIVIAVSVLVLLLADNYILLLIVGIYLVFITALVIIAALLRRDRDLYLSKDITVTSAAFAFVSPRRQESFGWDQGISSYRKLGPYHLVYPATGGFVVIPDRDIPASIKSEILELFQQKA